MEKKSNFISVLAWIFIIGGGFSTLISIMQAIMFNSMFQNSNIQTFPEHGPKTAKFMFENFGMFIYIFMIVSTTTFISALGLLKRKNWARYAFMGVLVFGIIWMLGSMLMQYMFFNDIKIENPGDGFNDFQTTKNIMTIFGSIMTITFIGIFVWLIKKLISKDIAMEFTLNKPLNQDAP